MVIKGDTRSSDNGLHEDPPNPRTTDPPIAELMWFRVEGLGFRVEG